MPSRELIGRFLAARHIALVGVSRNPKSFANAVYRRLASGGRIVYPVNPNADAVEGVRCFPSLADAPDPLDGVLVMVNPQAAQDVVRAAIARGVPMVWLHRGAGMGAVSPEAVALCREHDVEVVDGACPMMFDEPVGAFHRMHRLFVRHRFAA